MEKQGFFSRLVSGLTKTRDSFLSNLDSLFTGFTKIDEDFYEELEEILIMADIGVQTTQTILEDLKEKVKEEHIKEPEACKTFLIESIKNQMRVDEEAYQFEQSQSVILVVGVNGVGKTTTIGKLASRFVQDKKKVLICAADTFRAAATDQLEVWAKRAGVDMIKGNDNADPASVVYDSIIAAKARHCDVLLIDTAGRLHNKKNLMNELNKIRRIVEGQYPGVKQEVLVVLDGTTGQNALQQAKEFNEVTQLTGIVITKLDGTAKGGIAIGIQSQLQIPVKYIGVGEGIEDLQKFNPDTFVDALFSVKKEDEN